MDISPSNLDSSLCFIQPTIFMMYSVYKLNKQRDNIQPWCTPFTIRNQSIVRCLVLTVASWPAYRFLRMQVKWSGISMSLRVFQFIVIYTVPGFSVVNEAELDVYISHNISLLKFSTEMLNNYLTLFWNHVNLSSIMSTLFELWLDCLCLFTEKNSVSPSHSISLDFYSANTEIELPANE